MRDETKMNIICKLVFILLLLVSAKGSAQDFFSVSTGYGFSLASEVVSRHSIIVDDKIYEGAENDYGSFGQGYNFAVGYARMFTKEIGVSIDAQVKIGRTYESVWKGNMPPYQGTSQFTSEIYKQRVNYLALSPGIILKTELAPFQPYAKIGFVFALAKWNNDYTDQYNNSFRIVKLGDIAFGGFATAGVEYAVKNYTLFFEVAAIAMAWLATTEKSYPNNKKNLYYFDSDGGWPKPTWEPSKISERSANERFGLSSWNLNFGVKFQL